MTDTTEARDAHARLAHVLGVLDREGVCDPRDARKRLKLLGFDSEKTIAAAEKVLQCREAKRLMAGARAKTVPNGARGDPEV
jgi:hypothetical protein